MGKGCRVVEDWWRAQLTAGTQLGTARCCVRSRWGEGPQGLGDAIRPWDWPLGGADQRRMEGWAGRTWLHSPSWLKQPPIAAGCGADLPLPGQGQSSIPGAVERTLVLCCNYLLICPGMARRCLQSGSVLRISISSPGISVLVGIGLRRSAWLCRPGRTHRCGSKIKIHNWRQLLGLSGNKATLYPIYLILGCFGYWDTEYSVRW